MLQIKKISIPGYEHVIEGIDQEANLHCFIAIHSTELGPALGGVRIFPYTNDKEALADVLRLAKAMTVKSALADLPLGGGKSVIIADPKREKNRVLLSKFAEVVESLKGDYIVAEDVGSTVADMLILREKTSHVVALPTEYSSGDPSPFTAFGIIKGIESVLKHLFGNSTFEGITVAIQGIGNVGKELAEQLFWKGAHLILADIDREKAVSIAKKYGGEVVSPDIIHTVKCDIFSPCAMGGIVNSRTIREMSCKAIAGSANNQLECVEDDRLLFDKKILYAPDFVINAGGLINVSTEFDGYDPRQSLKKINNIFNVLSLILLRSKKEGRGTESIALELAKENLDLARLKST